MIKLTGKLLLIGAVLCGLIIFAGCGGSTPANNAAAPNTTKPANTAPKTTDTAKTDAAPAGEKIGVAECDEYIEKLEACLTSAPEASRAAVKSNLDMMRKQWKDAAANPQTKAGLATGCKAALDTAKTTYNYCKW